MNEDAELLRRYARDRDEAAFRAVVERHLGFVFAVNLRRLRDPHLASDATQGVFVVLAKKAGQAARAPSVAAWLHRCSCYESRNIMRARIHRANREREAVLIGSAAPAEPMEAAPGALDAVLDGALEELGAADRAAVLARFFEKRSFAEIGLSLGRSENAARMRVERALAKLRESLRRRGVESSAAALALALPGYAATTPPAGLAVVVAQAALGAAGASSGAALALFLMTNTQKILATAVVAALAGWLLHEQAETRRLGRELQEVAAEHARTQARTRGLERELAELRAKRASALVERAEPKAAAATAPAEKPLANAEEPAPRVTRKAPAGWFKNGSKPEAYVVGVDKDQSLGGFPSAYVKSTADADDENFGGMLQAVNVEAYRGQRVQLSGWIKTEEVSLGGQLWMRVDGESRVLQFDNMHGRAPKGTTDWEEYSVVLDVPKDAVALTYGFFVGGRGQMWVNGLRLRSVNPAVPSTDINAKVAKDTTKALPSEPRNIEFSTD